MTNNERNVLIVVDLGERDIRKKGFNPHRARVMTHLNTCLKKEEAVRLQSYCTTDYWPG